MRHYLRCVILALYITTTSHLLAQQITNFEEFKLVYHKNYTSSIEDAARLLQFTASAWRAFASRVRFALGASTSYGGLNQMSDWTRSEVAMLHTSSGDRCTANKQDTNLPEQHHDNVQIDHRQSGCLFDEVRDQGKCGSCYAFALVAAYEWLHCKETGKLVAFSEQYVLDCGLEIGMSGCDGGCLVKAAQFMRKFGMQLRDKYASYGARASTCTSQPGSQVVAGQDSMWAIELRTLEAALSVSPVLIGIWVGASFREYAGGVDSGDNCRMYPHAMLLVGSGRERGLDYWLLRNSYSSAWGERGHYKLAKSALSKCATYGAAFVARASSFSTM